MSTSLIYPNSGNHDGSIAVAAIRRRKQELQQEIEKLRADCDVLARAEELVTHDQDLAPITPNPLSINRRDLAAAESEVRPGGSDFPTGLRRAICALAEKLPERFTAAEVLRQLQAQGFKFAGDPKTGVRDAMYGLSRGKHQIFRIAVAGSGGGKPNLYQRA
jgi:hypothetical protein